MRVVQYETVSEFAARMVPVLAAREVENCVVLGRLWELAGARPPKNAGAHVWMGVEHGGHAVAGAMLAPPHPVVLTPAPTEAVEALAEHFARTGPWPLGVNGPASAAQVFLRAWPGRAGTVESDQHLGLYQLTRVEKARAAPGSFRAAAADDSDMLVGWAEAFLREVGLAQAREDCAAIVAHRIEEGRLSVWCDGGVVSMAGWAGRTPNGVRVNFVYTPPEFRGRGYASACVAALSRELLESGRKFCCLFTDLANPTSNRIYRAMGYRQVCDYRYVRWAGL